MSVVFWSVHGWPGDDWSAWALFSVLMLGALARLIHALYTGGFSVLDPKRAVVIAGHKEVPFYDIHEPKAVETSHSMTNTELHTNEVGGWGLQIDGRRVLLSGSAYGFKKIDWLAETLAAMVEEWKARQLE